ncbi:MAG: flippase [Candidatus Omnitrophota bacterium]
MHSLVRQIKKTYGMAHPHERKTVLRNFASLSVLQAITYLLPVLILPYLFRVIGPEKFGLIAFAQAFVQYFMILTDYGFSVSATKEISLCQHDRAEISKVFSSVMTAKLALAFVSLLLLGAIVYFIPKFRNDWMVYVFSFGMVLGNTLFPVWFFQGTEKMKYIADLNIAGGILTFVLILFCVRGPKDYLMVPLIASGVGLFTGLWGQNIAFKHLGISFRFPGYTNLKKQLTAGWDIFVSIVAINAYTTTRIFAIGLLTNNTITGFYSIAEKLAGLCQTFPLSSFSQALFPRLSKIFHKSKARAFDFMRRIQWITITISLICLPPIFIFARPIIQTLFGGNYPETVLSFRLLLISVFFISSNAFRVQFLLVCGKTQIYSRIHVIMAMIGLPMIFLLIDSFSYVGAAIATIMIEAGIFTITYFTVRRLKPS